MTDVLCPQNGLTMTALWEDGFFLTLEMVFRGTRQIFQMYHTEASCWRWEEVKGEWEINTTEGERERERAEKCSLPAWLTVDSVGCDFHSLLAVCVEAITSVTGRLINEPLSLSVQFEEGPRPYPRHHWFIRLWSKPPSITHAKNVMLNIQTHTARHMYALCDMLTVYKLVQCRCTQAGMGTEWCA